jgi:hypothetical protein
MNTGINTKSGFAMALTLLVAVVSTIANAQPGPIPAGYPEHTFGEPAPLPGGGKITLSMFEPDIYNSRTNQFNDLVETVSSLVHVEMCAGATELSKMASEVYFSLTRAIATGHESINGTPSTYVREPSLQPDYVPLSVAPGECKAGWVAFTTLGHEGDKVLEGASSITFDPAVLGMVPPEQQVKLAWRLPLE